MAIGKSWGLISDTQLPNKREGVVQYTRFSGKPAVETVAGRDLPGSIHSMNEEKYFRSSQCYFKTSDARYVASWPIKMNPSTFPSVSTNQSPEPLRHRRCETSCSTSGRHGNEADSWFWIGPPFSGTWTLAPPVKVTGTTLSNSY